MDGRLRRVHDGKRRPCRDGCIVIVAGVSSRRRGCRSRRSVWRRLAHVRCRRWNGRDDVDRRRLSSLRGRLKSGRDHAGRGCRPFRGGRRTRAPLRAGVARAGGEVDECGHRVRDWHRRKVDLLCGSWLGGGRIRRARGRPRRCRQHRVDGAGKVGKHLERFRRFNHRDRGHMHQRSDQGRCSRPPLGDGRDDPVRKCWHDQDGRVPDRANDMLAPRKGQSNGAAGHRRVVRSWPRPAPTVAPRGRCLGISICIRIGEVGGSGRQPIACEDGLNTRLGL